MKSALTFLALVLASLALPTASRAQTASTFTPGPCAVEVAPGERIDCGVLSVPEHRGQPDSRTIRLPVLIFRSRSTTPEPDPVVFLNGGPGNSALFGQRSGASNPFLQNRDQVLLEPRGARLAEPFLDCPDINFIRADPVTPDESGSRQEAAARLCRERLVAAGVDLDGYTSAETADDIEDLRIALGYPQINLYGLSYGTRLALTVARRHPSSVRAMVLDSVLPPDVNYDEAASANAVRALNVVFDTCAVDPACGRGYPNLRRAFDALVDGPDGAVIAEAVVGALADPRKVGEIPRVIQAASQGRRETLLEWIRASRTVSTFAWGLRLSVWCGEEMPFEDQDRMAAQVDPNLGLGGMDGRTTTPAVCRAWSITAAPPVENEPVQSDIPTLILAGELDPTTPPLWGRRLLTTMPSATFVEIPGRAHGASFNPCGGRMAYDFIQSPLTPPATACAGRTPPIAFAAP